MIDARFLSNNSITSDVNHVKCKILMQGSYVYKSPNKCKNWSKGSPMWGDYQKVKFLPFWGHVLIPGTDWHEILLAQADPCVPQLYKISRELVQ